MNEAFITNQNIIIFQDYFIYQIEPVFEPSPEAPDLHHQQDDPMVLSYSFFESLKKYGLKQECTRKARWLNVALESP